MGETLGLLVADVRLEAEGVRCLELARPTGADLPSWSPGAHIDVHLQPGLTRQYSLCGDHRDRSRYRLAVLREPDSRGGSAFVHEALEIGHELTISAPRNNFDLVPAPSYTFIAGGIGITPLLAMAREVSRTGTPWTMTYGGRSRTSMAFVDELRTLGADRVTLMPQDEDGLPDLVAVLSGTPTGSVVYCCGPTGLIDAVLDTAARLRPDLDVRIERFRAVEVEQTGPDAAFDVVLARQDARLTVPAGTSILVALRDAGYSPDSACEEGACGSCEVGVLGGLPDHRDSVLSEGERAENSCMMICVGRSLTPELVLDL